MKLFIIFSLCLVAIESAQMRGFDKKNNLAVLLTYKPNTEIQTKDENNKSWTYKLPSAQTSTHASEELNRKLMEMVSKMEKRENHKRQVPTSSSYESNEEIDEAKVVEINNKKTCYKNTYKNVLQAFEDALKSQIHNYKKCVCQKKKPVTTTSSTTTSTTLEPSFLISQRNMGDGDDGGELTSALDHSNDFICFHKQYAFMLNKLLETYPCNNNPIRKNSTIDVNEYYQHQSEKKNRNERQLDETGELKQQIKAIMKEYISRKKFTTTTTTTTSTTTLPPPPPPPQSIEEEINDEDKFFERLRNLFQQLESDDDQTFPMSKNKSAQPESAASMSSPKSPRRKFSSVENSTSRHFRKSRKIEQPTSSTYSGRVVTEHSDESTESSFKLKKGKSEKEHFKFKENLREIYSKNTKSSSGTSKSSSEEKESQIDEEMFNNEEGGRNVDDDRLATHLAKTISDFAKRYMKN